MSIVLEFLSDRRQCMHLEGKVSASVNLVSGVTQLNVLGPLLYILYTSEIFHIVGNYIMGYADDTTINAVIPRRFLRPAVMELL